LTTLLVMGGAFWAVRRNEAPLRGSGDTALMVVTGETALTAPTAGPTLTETVLKARVDLVPVKTAPLPRPIPTVGTGAPTLPSARKQAPPVRDGRRGLPPTRARPATIEQRRVIDAEGIVDL